MSLPRLSIARPVAVAMFFIAIVFLGAISVTRLPVDLLPDIAYPKLIIYTTYPDASPAEVERTITNRLEAAVATVSGKERLESTSRFGVSLIVIRFAWGTNMDFATLNVREKVDGARAGLPTSASRPMVLRTDPRSEPMMAISVSGAADLWSLKELSQSVFRRRLEQIDGVAQAAVTGGLEQEIQVEVDPEKLASYGITINEIATAIDASNASSGSGTILRGRYRYSLRLLGELQTVRQIEETVIRQPSTSADQRGGSVVLRDVATVVNGFRDRESIARYNGAESVGLLVFKESGANTVRVAETVEEVLVQLRSEYPEVTADVAMSQAGFVASAIANLIQEMILGGVLAFLVLVLFLRDPRYPVAIAIAIPISVITTFALFHLTGVSLNIMSLGGLALGTGMLVDNSIVVIENIFRHIEKGLRAAAAAALGTEEVQRAITAATLTTIAVFGPIVYVEGVAGELFASLSFAVAFSLLASLLVAVTLLPSMAARWDQARLPKHRPLLHTLAAPLRAFDRVWDRIAGRYGAALNWSLRHRARVVFASLVLLAVTIPVALSLPRSVLPEVDQGEFRARIELARGMPLATTAAVATQLERMLRADPGVDVVFSRIGTQVAAAGMTEETSGVNSALLEVRLKPGQSTEEVLERIRPQLAAFPPRSVSLETGHATALGKLLGAGEADLALRIRGDHTEAALYYAQQAAPHLAARPELTNVRVGTDLGQPEFEVHVNRDRAIAYGIDVTRITAAVENHMRGRFTTNEFVAFDRKIPIVVRLPDAERQALTTLYELRVNNVPLRELITVREAVAPAEIQRLDQSRVIPVYADAVGRDLEEAVLAMQQVVSANPPPPGLRAEVGGENEEMRRSFRELAIAFTLAVLLVYMILAAEFESLVHPFTVLLSVPLGVIGAIFALWLFGSGLNTISLIGIVILVGIVDNNAVVMLDFIGQERRAGKALREAILEAGRARLRPIVMSTLTTMLAVMPMVLGIGAGSGLQAPLAIAIFGGLFTATALTLLVIPVVYELIEELRVWVLSRSLAPLAATPADGRAIEIPSHAAAAQWGGDR